MDAVIFEWKGAHLALQRLGRGLLRRLGITPARFDLMHALGRDGMKQSALWRRLNVVRSVVCEMLGALEALGLVRRVRDEEDGRTWLVKLTARGRALCERVYERWMDSGDVTLFVDRALTGANPEIDVESERFRVVETCTALQSSFLPPDPLPGWDLYTWHWEDYGGAFAEVGLPTFPGQVPFVA